MKSLCQICSLFICVVAVAGCGPGPGDPDAPIDNPPSTDAAEVGNSVAPSDVGVEAIP
jgi:hypothetical protein